MPRKRTHEEDVKQPAPKAQKLQEKNTQDSASSEANTTEPELQTSFTNNEGVINDPELLASLFVRLHQINSGAIIEDQIIKFTIKEINQNSRPVYFISSEGKKTFIAIPPKCSTEVAAGVLITNDADEVMSLILQTDGSYGLAPTSVVLGIDVPPSYLEFYTDDDAADAQISEALSIDIPPPGQGFYDDDYNFTPPADGYASFEQNMSMQFYNELCTLVRRAFLQHTSVSPANYRQN